MSNYGRSCVVMTFVGDDEVVMSGHELSCAFRGRKKLLRVSPSLEARKIIEPPFRRAGRPTEQWMVCM